MSLSNMRSRAAVLEVLAEYDRLGQDGFLHKYGYGKRTRYTLRHEGRLYDPKAVLGVAHGVEFPAEGPLWWKSFNGGEQTNKKLRELGFEIIKE